MLFACFATVAVIAGSWLDLGIEDLTHLLHKGRDRPAWCFAAVVCVLAIDSFSSIPTLLTVAVAGNLLGPLLGGLSGLLGILAAGSICYWGARWAGQLGDKKQRFASVRTAVGEIGAVPLLLGRAAPMLPEVLSTLAGLGGMKSRDYYLYFLLGNLPFAFVVAYAGSISTLESPLPTVAVAVGVPVCGGLALVVRRRRLRKRDAVEARESTRLPTEAPNTSAPG